MLDPISHQRAEFRTGSSIHLTDGQAWILPSPYPAGELSETYEALLESIVQADNRRELLCAELALGIQLILANYAIPPLLLGGLLDFPNDSAGLHQFQTMLHGVAMEHVRAYRPVDETALNPVPATDRIHRPLSRFRLFNRQNTSLSA